MDAILKVTEIDQRRRVGVCNDLSSKSSLFPHTAFISSLDTVCSDRSKGIETLAHFSPLSQVTPMTLVSCLY